MEMAAALASLHASGNVLRGRRGERAAVVVVMGVRSRAATEEGSVERAPSVHLSNCPSVRLSICPLSLSTYLSFNRRGRMYLTSPLSLYVYLLRWALALPRRSFDWNKTQPQALEFLNSPEYLERRNKKSFWDWTISALVSLVPAYVVFAAFVAYRYSS